MSTKISKPDTAFNRMFWIVTAILSAICLVFIVLNSAQGPRLRRVEVDQTQVIRASGQRLVMYANQPLNTIENSQISISPSVSFAAAVSGETLSLQFNQRLLYNTEYRVTVNDVAGKYSKHGGITFRYSFKTADPTLYFLQRHMETDVDNFLSDKKNDEIIRTTLSGTKQTTIFSAEKIQDYVLLGDNMLVTTINGETDENTTNSLYLVNTKTGKTEELSLPDSGTVTNLRASPNQRLAGFSFTSSPNNDQLKYESILFNVDLAANHLEYPIDGLDGKPLQVVDWQFAPDGTTIIAQTNNSNLLLLDTNGQNKPLPLGQFNSMENFSYNGGKLIVSNNMDGPLVLDLLAHVRTPITASSIDGGKPYLQNARLLSNSEGLIKNLSLYNDKAESYNQYLVISRDGSEKTIYTNSGKHEQIVLYSGSPNDQYLLAEVYDNGKTGKNDLYPDTPKQVGTQTKIIDIKTGKTTKTIDGFKVIWQ